MSIIDFHAHILPGADHGSESRAVTAAQLELLQAAGVETVVATPHFYPQSHSVESFLKRREAAKERLLTVDVKRPRVCLGAEVLVCPGIDHMPRLEELCIAGTRTILLEMPFHRWGKEHIEAVRRIAEKGLVPVMAHVDRYPLQDLERLYSECSVLCQLNAESQKSLKGRRKAKRIAESFSVAAVGSDIHGADKKSVKNLVRLWEKLEKQDPGISEKTKELLEGATPL